ncbi:hypothetical protein [Sphingomonas panaciterrae]|uniref:hypothetical protein n=1 Tax=Sphingomonas panaciterrae TaxID=1462999 RepID=UPI002FF34C93
MTKHKFLRQRVFHDGTSMIVAKKGDSHPVPDELLNDFVIDKSIEKPKGWKHPDGVETVDDDEGDDDTGASTGAYTMKYKPVGKYVIAGPNLPAEGETVSGKEAAEKRLAELTEAHTAGGEGAPTE